MLGLLFTTLPPQGVTKAEQGPAVGWEDLEVAKEDLFGIGVPTIDEGLIDDEEKLGRAEDELRTGNNWPA